MKSVLVFVLLCFFTINYAEGACVVPECRAGNISCKAFNEPGSYALVNNNCNISGVNIKPNDIICGCGEVKTGEALREISGLCISFNNPCTYARVCAKGYYGDPYSNGCHRCSDGGTTNGTGATQVYNCYKIIEKDTPDGHGRRKEKCYFQMSANGYTNCVAEDEYPKVISCKAGYYAVGSECSPVGKGYYSPDSDTERYQCPSYKKGSLTVSGTTATTTSASITDCMVPAYSDNDPAKGKETFTDYKGTYYFPNNCKHP